MEDLQSTLQSILSDPKQMDQIMAMAQAFGVMPPEGAQAPADSPPQAEGAPAQILPQGAALADLMGGLGAMQGSEDRVFAALRPTMSVRGQARLDRASKAAKLARLLGQFLGSRGGGSHV